MPGDLLWLVAKLVYDLTNRERVRLRFFVVRVVINAYLDDLIKCKVINIIAIFFLKDHKVGELADVVVFVHDFLYQISLLVLCAFRVEVCLLAFEFHAFGLCLYHIV